MNRPAMKGRSEAVTAGVVLSGAAAALAATAMVLDAPVNDLVVMGASLLATGGAGLLAAVAASRWSGWLGVGGQLALFAALLCGLLVSNIGVAAALMFISAHDLRLLFILSAYALLATAGPGLMMSGSVSRRVNALQSAAERVAAGELSTRVAVSGSDEIARLARSFNVMAGSLEAASGLRAETEQARRDLLAAISHDLRTPLASMRVMVEAISDGVADDDATRERYLRTMGGEIGRLSLLIDDLFELASIDSGQLRLHRELVRIEDVVAEAVDAFRPQVERAGIRLAFEPAAQTRPVPADPQRIGRVLYNLLQNALRHTPGDGTIVLRTRLAPGGVTIAISDSGEGIAPADMPHVFDRFYRGEKSRSREYGGSGLGLSIARGIIEAHGGRIWVEDAPDRGATIAFLLPSTP